MSEGAGSDRGRALLARALAELERAEARIAELEAGRSQPAALIGIGCRFGGGVRGPEALWQRLLAGDDLVGQVPEGRWIAPGAQANDEERAEDAMVRHGSFIENVFQFDPARFGIAPREVPFIDPQHRLLLEAAVDALEDAGLPAQDLRGSRTGVFVGISAQDHATFMAEHLPRSQIVAAAGTGSAHSAAAGRIAYALGLEGPALCVDTACSSSLVAMHLALQSLRSGECDYALVGGVNVLLNPQMSLVFRRAQMLSPTGRCRTFGADADGYVRGEGVGMVVLTRQDAARGHRVRALVRGSAVNQDGASGGLTVPSRPAQARVIRAALQDAGLDAKAVHAIEAHGTGTPLGDPQELSALADVFAAQRGGSPLVVASVKTNLGHLEAAAGIAGVIKAALQLEHGGQVVPHLHAEPRTTEFDWGRHPFVVPTGDAPASTLPEGAAIGVSSFGFTGTNAHVILQGAAPSAAPLDAGSDSDWPLLFSAHDAEARDRLLASWAAAMEEWDELPSGLASVLARGRSALPWRAAFAATDAKTLAQRLRAASRGEAAEETWIEAPRDRVRRRLAFVIGPEEGAAEDAGWLHRLGLRPKLLVVAPNGAAATDAFITATKSERVPVLQGADAAAFRALTAREGPGILLACGASAAAMQRLADACDPRPLVLSGSRAARLAGLWVAGERFDMQAVYGDGPRSLAGLPLYPFARHTWRLPGHPASQGSSTLDARSDHPLVGPVRTRQPAPIEGDPVLATRATVAMRSFRSQVEIDAVRLPWMHDHRVLGDPWWTPGLALEAALGFVRALKGSGRIVLERIAWTNNPFLALPRATDLEVTAQAQAEGGLALRVCLRQGGARATQVLRAEVPLLPASIDLTALNAAGDEPLDFPGAAWSNRERGARVQVDSPARAVEESDGTRWELPPSTVDREAYLLHPLLWNALLLKPAGGDDADAYRCARSLRHLEVHGAGAGRFRVQPAASGAIEGASFTLESEDGELLVAAAGLQTSIAVPDGVLTTRPDPEGMAYRCGWQSVGRSLDRDTAPARRVAGSVTVIPVGEEAPRDCVSAFEARGAVVRIGAIEDDSVAGAADDLVVLFAGAGVDAAACEDAMHWAARSAALSKAPRCALVTRGALECSALRERGGDLRLGLQPFAAALHGFFRSWALEQPQRVGLRIDSSGTVDWSRVAGCLLEWEPSEEELVLDGSEAWVPRWIEAPELQKTKAWVAEDLGAHVLVTGGTGALAMAFLDDVLLPLAASSEAARFVVTLLVRDPEAPGLLALQDKWKRAGADLQTVSADLNDESRVAAALREVRNRQGSLGSVFHFAGVTEDGPVVGLDVERVRRVLAVKLRTAVLLEEAMREQPEAKLVLIGSAAAILGNAGQAAYGAANAGLDAVAARRRGAGAHAVCISFGPLLGGGMNIAADRLAARGVHPIEARRAMRALPHLCDSASPDSLVIDVDWERLTAALRERVHPRRFELLAPPEPGASAAATEALAERLAATPEAEQETLLGDWFRRMVAKASGTSATNIQASTRLADLGLDSLMAADVAAAVEEQLQVQPSRTRLLEDVTVADLEAELLAAWRGAADGNAEAALLDELSDLDDATLEQLFEEDPPRG